MSVANYLSVFSKPWIKMSANGDFLTDLSNYVNGGRLDRTDKLISSFSKTLPFSRNAGRIRAKFKDLKVLKDGLVKEIRVTPYTGINSSALQMKEYLKTKLAGDLLEAVVHGSIGTGEEISYSDFDALVILKDDAFESSRRIRHVAMKLSHARGIMYEFDPLQHHGWFVLTESSLKNYPMTYFPPELFEHSKSILHSTEQRLEILLPPALAFGYAQGTVDVNGFKPPFYRLCNSLSAKLSEQKLPENIYAVKNLMSEFMLLPALYVQARDGKGLFKKFSFDSAKMDFSTAQWNVMDEVSQLRLNWKISLPESTRKKLVVNMDAKRNFLTGGSVPDALRKTMNANFLSRMLVLVRAAKEKIK